MKKEVLLVLILFLLVISGCQEIRESPKSNLDDSLLEPGQIPPSRWVGPGKPITYEEAKKPIKPNTIAKSSDKYNLELLNTGLLKFCNFFQKNYFFCNIFRLTASTYVVELLLHL